MGNPINFITLLRNDLFIAFLLFAGVLLLERVINITFKKSLKKWIQSREHVINDEVMKEVGPAIFRLFIVLAVRAFYSYLSVKVPYLSQIINTLLVIVSINLVIHIFELILKVWTKGIRKNLFPSSFSNDVADSFSPIIKKLIRVLLILIGVIIVLRVWNIDDLITPLLGGVGIAGVAVSFAAQKSLGDFIGGISLATDASFKVGDIIEVKSMNLSGTVEDIGLRSTRVKTWDNEIVIVPNGQLSSSNIINFNLPDNRIRVRVPYSISYGGDVKKAKKIALRVAKSQENFIKHPEPNIVFLEMNDFSLDFELRFWVRGVSNRWMSKWNATDQIYQKFIENGISIPFPTRTINFHDKTIRENSKENSTKNNEDKTSKTKKNQKD